MERCLKLVRRIGEPTTVKVVSARLKVFETTARWTLAELAACGLLHAKRGLDNRLTYRAVIPAPKHKVVAIRITAQERERRRQAMLGIHLSAGEKPRSVKKPVSRTQARIDFETRDDFIRIHRAVGEWKSTPPEYPASIFNFGK